MRAAILISCSRTLLIAVNPLSGSESELPFAIAFFDRRLPGTFGEPRGNGLLQSCHTLPMGRKDEALVLPQLQGHTGRASVAEAN